MLKMELLTVGAAAQELGITPQAVRNRIRAGTLAAVEIRGKGAMPVQYAVSAESVELSRLRRQVGQAARAG